MHFRQMFAPSHVSEKLNITAEQRRHPSRPGDARVLETTYSNYGELVLAVARAAFRVVLMVRFLAFAGPWRGDSRPRLVVALGSFVATMLFYPGNVRELASVLWASLRESRGPLLAWPPSGAPDLSGGLAPAVAAERSAPTPEEISQALARHGGNHSKAYADLGLTSRYALRRLLKKQRAPE